MWDPIRTCSHWYECRIGVPVSHSVLFLENLLCEIPALKLGCHPLYTQKHLQVQQSSINIETFGKHFNEYRCKIRGTGGDDSSLSPARNSMSNISEISGTFCNLQEELLNYIIHRNYCAHYSHPTCSSKETHTENELQGLLFFLFN